MKKIIICFILFLFIYSLKPIYASNATEIINSQKNSLNISNFISESENYTTDFLKEVDLNNLLNSAITGNIDNNQLIKNAWTILGKEVANAVTTLGSILVIIIIHSIIKSISDSLENKSVSQIAYYVQYILIVTIVMVNFADIINMVKVAIQNLVDFINLLLPLLVTLMVATRKNGVSHNVTTYNSIYNNTSRKFNNKCNNTTSISFNSVRDNIANIR